MRIKTKLMPWEWIHWHDIQSSIFWFYLYILLVIQTKIKAIMTNLYPIQPTAVKQIISVFVSDSLKLDLVQNHSKQTNAHDRRKPLKNIH